MVTQLALTHSSFKNDVSIENKPYLVMFLSNSIRRHVDPSLGYDNAVEFFHQHGSTLGQDGCLERP